MHTWAASTFGLLWIWVYKWFLLFFFLLSQNLQIERFHKKVHISSFYWKSRRSGTTGSAVSGATVRAEQHLPQEWVCHGHHYWWSLPHMGSDCRPPVGTIPYLHLCFSCRKNCFHSVQPTSLIPVTHLATVDDWPPTHPTPTPPVDCWPHHDMNKHLSCSNWQMLNI